MISSHLIFTQLLQFLLKLSHYKIIAYLSIISLSYEFPFCFLFSRITSLCKCFLVFYSLIYSYNSFLLCHFIITSNFWGYNMLHNFCLPLSPSILSHITLYFTLFQVHESLENCYMSICIHRYMCFTYVLYTYICSYTHTFTNA